MSDILRHDHPIAGVAAGVDEHIIAAFVSHDNDVPLSLSVEEIYDTDIRNLGKIYSPGKTLYITYLKGDKLRKYKQSDLLKWDDMSLLSV